MGSEFWISCRYLKWSLKRLITVHDPPDPLGIQTVLLLGPLRISGPMKISMRGCVRPMTVLVSIRWTCGNLVSWPEKRRRQRGSGRAVWQSRRDHEDGLQRLQQNVCRWAPWWTATSPSVYRMTCTTRVLCVLGKLKPTMAFMSGKLRIKGDMTMAIKLEKLMGRMNKAKLWSSVLLPWPSLTVTW